MGDVMAVGIGFVFCGMWRGGGGRCDGFEPVFWLPS
jgi:hypothetical protein